MSKKKSQQIKYTKFGKTRLVEATVYNDPPEGYTFSDDEILWVERDEDYYGVNFYIENYKYCAVVTRENWLVGEEII